ncbi:MAG: amidohydrolase [Acidimicrobiia bacterium]|nr:amidohydrolase [Acidimicrobiia bacterium]
MNVDDMILVSVDDHVVEPPDLFEGRLPARYRDEAPVLVHREDGTDAWRYLGMDLPNVGLNAVVGRPREEYGLEPTALDEIRPGCYDVHERVRDMDANGMLGSLCYPSFPQFCGQLWMKTPDKDLAITLLRAYNDWHIEEWCGAHPGRFIPLGLLPLWDPQLMAEEVRRLAGKGCHAISFSENPARLGLPSLHSDHWDPFWAACEDEGTVVNMHIGSSSQLVVTADDAPMDVLITLQPMNIVQAAADLIWSPVFRKFPTFKIALAEGGIGWIPYFLDRIDYTYEHHHAWTGQDFGDRLPSQVFKERIITCFIDDPTGVHVRDRVGIDSITWECDYPHSDCTWPTSPEDLGKSLAGVPDADVNKITHENAMRLYRYDPFAHRPRERCTVGALRAEAEDVDTAIRSRGKRFSEHGALASDLRDGKVHGQ